MKKIIALLLCIGIFAVAASGCGGSSSKDPVATSDEAGSLEASDYDNDFEGLCNYLSAYGYINPLKENEGVTYTITRAEIIGASKGRRFETKKIKDTPIKDATIELYEYDLEALSSTPDEAAEKTISSVKQDGTFENLLGETVKDVYLSKNGRFLMIYNGKDDGKDELVERFQNFHADDK